MQLYINGRVQTVTDEFVRLLLNGMYIATKNMCARDTAAVSAIDLALSSRMAATSITFVAKEEEGVTR